MEQLEVIARDILALKLALSIAWQKLALENLTEFERLDTRVQMQKAQSDLRHALRGFQREHDRLRKIHARENEKQTWPHVKLRLFEESVHDQSSVHA